MQLMRLRPALRNCDVTFVTTVESYRESVGRAGFRVVTDASRQSKARLVVLALQMLWLMLSLRPDVIISTGAAPGCIAVRLGNWFGCRTLWIDSIANAERLSRSAELVSSHADVVLSQWEHVATANRVRFEGAII